jgi:hypothetical protein
MQVALSQLRLPVGQGLTGGGGDRVGERVSRYEAVVAPDGRIQGLSERIPDGERRSIQPESPEGMGILAAGLDILYRFDEGRRLRDLTYPGVLEAMRQEVRLTLHKVSHGELLDEPELVPALRRLLDELEATAAAFRNACRSLRTEA